MKINFNLRKPNKSNIYTLFLTTTLNGVRLFYNTRIKGRKGECDLFVDWFWLKHPTKMHHWKSLKKIVRMGA